MAAKHNARILIVDDEPEIREVLQDILSRKFDHVDTAENGRVALDMVQQEDYDALVVDFNMPELSGQELVKEIRDSGDQKTAFIMLTGHGTFKEAQTLVNEYGISDFLNKPTERARLLFSLNRALREKKSEIELIQHRNELEVLVEERTSDMKIACKEAERANLAKSEFLSHMSHELRTPMNAIIGFCQLMKLDSEELTEPHQNNVTEILVAANHLLGLINGLLDLAAIEAGKVEVSVTDVLIEDVTQSSIALIQPLAEARDVEIIDNISDQGYAVKADFNRIKQVFVNILSNAVKYNREHGRITLDGEIVDLKYLRLGITDTGVGIDPEGIESLFEPFIRLDEKTNIEGTGIGLTITKNLVELMYGRIGVESTPGEGSTFWIELPLVK